MQKNQCPTSEKQNRKENRKSKIMRANAEKSKTEKAKCGTSKQE